MTGRDQSGFVLIELMIMLVVMSILAALILLSIDQFSGSARDAKDGANDDTCSTAIAAYRAEHGVMPLEDDDLTPYFHTTPVTCLP